MKIKAVKSYYSSAQVVQYLSSIKYPNPPNEDGIEAGLFPCTLKILERIIRLHLIAFPMENTAMHYTAEHVMDVSPEGVFKRFILSKKRYGSYCFGQNGLFLGMLRGLGYRAYPGPARVNTIKPPASRGVDLTPQSHMIVFVQTSCSPGTYLTDVGFGGFGIVRPILVEEGSMVKGACAPEEHRLTRARHPSSSLEPAASPELDTALEWRVEFRCGTFQPDWHVIYQFTLDETYPVDRDAANFEISQREGVAPFFKNLLCISHFLVDGKEDAESNGDLGRMVLFGNRVDRRIGDKSEKLAVLKSDIERIRALKKYFGMDIPEADVVHIEGRAAQLK